MRNRHLSTISSGGSTLTPANTSVYSATKAAVDAVTRSLAKELGPRKIRVNATNPGMVERRACTTSLPRVFFASGDSAHITGETVLITGGLH